MKHITIQAVTLAPAYGDYENSSYTKITETMNAKPIVVTNTVTTKSSATDRPDRWLSTSGVDSLDVKKNVYAYIYLSKITLLTFGLSMLVIL